MTVRRHSLFIGSDPFSPSGGEFESEDGGEEIKGAGPAAIPNAGSLGGFPSNRDGAGGDLGVAGPGVDRVEPVQDGGLWGSWRRWGFEFCRSAWPIIRIVSAGEVDQHLRLNL